VTFQFENFTAFVEMAGHGPYVWTAYGFSIVILGWLILRPIKQRRDLFRLVAREIKRQQQQQHSE